MIYAISAKLRKLPPSNNPAAPPNDTKKIHNDHSFAINKNSRFKKLFQNLLKIKYEMLIACIWIIKIIKIYKEYLASPASMPLEMKEL